MEFSGRTDVDSPNVDSPVQIESIFHPSDFSAASEIAFIHALKLALLGGATLRMLHVDPGYSAEWGDFPGVRTTLERWHLIPEGSPKRAVPQLGIDVTKFIAESRKPIEACLKFLVKHPADLIVLAVHQHDGRIRWLDKGVGGPVAVRARLLTLFIPEGVPGFVSWEDGSLSLQSILIPIAHKPSAQPAVDAVARMIRNLRLPPGEVTLLHAGSSQDVPSIRIPEDSGWRWSRLVQEGTADDVIVQTAETMGAGMIVMTTEGPHGFLDALRGSTSERVMRRSRCPMGSVPVPQFNVEQ